MIGTDHTGLLSNLHCYSKNCFPVLSSPSFQNKLQQDISIPLTASVSETWLDSGNSSTSAPSGKQKHDENFPITFAHLQRVQFDGHTICRVSLTKRRIKRE
uniref:Uncharacterized protein n=1 Tax=Onchocerca volvulus TaxID=6282 RepID=A0A8R1TWC0_ONCVO